MSQFLYLTTTHDYEAPTGSKCLSFKAGDRIKFLRNSSEIDYFWGRLNDQEGYVARSYTKEFREFKNVLIPVFAENVELSDNDDLSENTEMVNDNSEQIDEDMSTTLICSVGFEHFSVNDKANFFKLRTDSRCAYFDRTQYITEIESFPEYVLLFLRPRQFGKSLTLSMLNYFHGVQHKGQYDRLFKDLAVNKDVMAGHVIPGQYLILSFDFSKIYHSTNVGIDEALLNNMINNSIKRFYRIYASYLEMGTSTQLIEKLVNKTDSISSLRECVSVVEEKLLAVSESGDKDHKLAGVKGIYLIADEYDALSNEFRNTLAYHNSQSLLTAFWATVKSNGDLYRIMKCFITGVLPISTADYISGLNITDVSQSLELSGLCGLSKADVLSALRYICPENIENYYRYMVRHYTLYRFSPSAKAPRVFNTNICLRYLQNIIKPRLRYDPSNLMNGFIISLLSGSVAAHIRNF